MIGLVDYISRNPCQPAKRISKYNEEFLVSTLSHIHTDSYLLQQKHNVSAITLNKFITKINLKYKILASNILSKY